MLTAIRDFFDKHLGAAAPGNDGKHAIEVACAVLLVEVVRMDGEIQEAERAVALRAVREKFGLSPEDAAALIQLAEDEAQQATDFFQFTSLSNKQFTPEQKVRLIEHMWGVAYADAELSLYEEHLVRKIADLLYVPHSAYIAAKLKARDAATN
jgi:uncharacterized tellurite resistance protein B-like protein